MLGKFLGAAFFGLVAGAAVFSVTWLLAGVTAYGVPTLFRMKDGPDWLYAISLGAAFLVLAIGAGWHIVED